MGKSNNFYLKSQLETRKTLFLIGLVLGSVLVFQYFEIPYSLLSYGKAYFSFSEPNRSEIGFDGKIKSNVDNNSKEDEGKIINSIAPQRASDSMVSPSYSSYVPDDEIAIGRIGFRPAPAPEKSCGSDGISPSIGSLVENSRNAESPNGIGPIGFGRAPAPEKSGGSDGISPSIVSFVENFRNAEGPNSLDVNPLSPIISPPSPSMFHDNIENGGRLAPCSPPSDANESGSSPSVANEGGSSDRSDGGNAPISDGHESKTKIAPPKRVVPDRSSPVAPSVLTISDMNDMLARSRASSFSEDPLWPSAADQELLDARFEIEHGEIIRNHPGLYAPIYRNLSTFLRSYEIMEKKLKIYIYNEGKRPVFHQPRLRGIYASEGWFMKLLEASDRFITRNPGEAHLFYLPFSTQLLVDYVYVKDSHTFHDIIEYLKGYLGTITTRYPFWNRTDGVDHFLVACHDWAPVETRRIMSKCIRAMCNADVKEGFQFGKDVSLPETYVHSPQNPLAKDIGGKPPSERKILAFFAGQMHGYVRPILLKHWENKDPEMKIFSKMKKGSYVWHMKSSKYCICAKGYEVNSPRVVEAIVYGCVPVILSDNFVPPFFDVLKWESFSVFVLEKDIPNLKNILLSIPEKRYVVMQNRVKMVRQHFLWHNKPIKYDIFHMILHSVWFNRVFQLKPR